MKILFTLPLFFVLLCACGTSSSYGYPIDDGGEDAAIASEIATGRAESKIYDDIQEAQWDSYAETAEAEDFYPPTDEEDLTISCLSWKEAHLHYGEYTCVTGTVTSTYNSGDAFFINFSTSRSAFYLVSFEYTWTELEGKCIVAYGKIIQYENRPEVIIRDPQQLESCS